MSTLNGREEGLRRSRLSTAISTALFGLACQLTAQGAIAQAQSEEELEEVVVTGLRESLTKGLDIKRDSIQIIDAIVAEDIGKFPDNNVAESLQRVSGIQVTDRARGEVAKVSIRGLDDVTTTINGRNIFTTTRRSLALADIPATLINRLDVYKTRSADLIETGIGGQIDIHTQRPFNFDGGKVSLAARGIYQEQSDDIDPNVSALFSNRWEMGGGEFGALLNLSYAETSYRDQSVTAGAMVPFFTTAPPPGFVPFQRIDTVIGGRDVWQPGLESGLPFAPGSTLPVNGVQYPYVLSRDAVFAADVNGKRERPAANIALQFAPNDKSEYVFEAFYNGYRDDRFTSLLFSFVDWWGALPPNAASTIELYPGTNVVKSRSTVGAPYGFTSGDLLTGKTDSYLYALGGKWDITDAFKLKADLAYQTSKFEEDFFAMRTERVAPSVSVDFNSGGGLPAFAFPDDPATTAVNESDLTDPRLWTIAQLYDNADRDKGDAVTFTLDGDYETDWSFIKTVSFGTRYDVRSAIEAQRRQDSDGRSSGNGVLGLGFATQPQLFSVNSDFFDGQSAVPTRWSVPNGHYIRSNADEVRRLYNDRFNGTPADISLAVGDQLRLTETFDVEETTTSLYLQADFATELGGRTFDGQFGVRYVDVETDMDFTDFNSLERSSASASTSKVLPSLALRFALTDDLNLRFNYGETLRRPNFTDLNATIIYTADVTNIGYGTATGGNPDLKPTESKNYDLSLEWYFAESSAVYGTAFKREIEGFVVNFARRVTFESYDYILVQPDNASDGELEGFEFGIVHFPDYLPPVLQGLGIQASYTLLDSTQDIPITNNAGEVVGTETTPMFGVSDSSYSVTLAYDKDVVDVRLAYVWREDFLNNYEARLFANPLGIYRAPEKSLDLQVSVNAIDNLTLTFDATNLTDEMYQSYYQYPTTHNFGSLIYGRTFALGARYSF